MKSKRARWVLGSLLTLILVAFVDVCAIEPYWIRVTEHEVAGAPAELVILHLTDIHMRRMGRRERRVLEIAQEVGADAIVITGDVISPGYDPDAVAEFLSSLEAPLGVWACRGNHEAFDPSALAVIRRAGVRLLEDELAELAPGVTIVGLASDTPLYVPAGEGYTIVLCHYPAVMPRAARAGADLVLAGHTHGGQVRIPFVGALWLPRGCDGYLEGWFQEGETRMYVCRGVGVSILPIRFFCRPEVAVHRLRTVP